MKKFCKPLLLVVAFGAALAAAPVSAHKAFLLPSSTVMSGADDWVTVDAAIGDDLFFFDHQPMQLTNLAVYAPDGNRVQPQNANTGRYRSTFDVRLNQPGTYKMAVLNNALIASFKVDGVTKRWRGLPENFARDVPANAQDLEVTQLQNRLETFVTAGKPSDKVLQLSGTGLEMQPVTHPNDLVAGEPASFRLMLDGKPAAGLKVTVIAGGIRYRNDQKQMQVSTDADGKFSVTWPAAGMYYMEASVRDKATSVQPAKERRAAYGTTLEVLPK